MKKILLSLALTLSLGSFASKYSVEEQSVDNLFANSTEITFEQKMASELTPVSQGMNLSMPSDTKTRTGYLVRAFFCGGIALHRYYMGTNKKAMWAMYLCIPVFGGINACVDFWWVVFNKEALDKYSNNDSYVVW